jgi:hypothetical protein
MSSNIIEYNDKYWKTMRMLKDAINLSKERNIDGRFNKAIEKDTALLNEFIEEYKH